MTGAELDKDVRAELSSLGPYMSKEVARHLVMVGRLIDDEPETAWLHAAAARGRGARLAAVREAVGIAAYRTGRYAEALAELRTVRRLTGSNVHLPVMADCERGIGRPERALALATSPEASTLDASGRIELRIVAAGARMDLGQADAAVLTLRIPELDSKAPAPWLARLRSAYADALDVVGRHEEARAWLEKAAEVDETGETGAAERLDELDGIELVDLEDETDEPDEPYEPDEPSGTS